MRAGTTSLDGTGGAGTCTRNKNNNSREAPGTFLSCQPIHQILVTELAPALDQYW